MSPADLPFEEASQWILGGRINAAFDAARLARPEVASARILTKPTARSHIWEITVRLYGGVTLSDVRGQVSRIKGALSAPWLRIAPHEFGCTIFVGQQPAKAQLADARKDALRLKKLDWDQGFVEAKITGNNGLLAELKKADVLPNNDKVEVLDFLLPPGMDLLKVRAGLKVLGVATGNAFLDVRPGVNGAASMRLLACTEDPMPTRVDYDFNHVGQGIPFATGIDGEALELDFADNPHVMVAGSSGGGKAQPLRSMIPVPCSVRFPNGWATIGELETGDELFASDGSVQRVVDLSPITHDPVYRLHLSDGQIVESSGEHMWKVATGFDRARFSAPRVAERTRHQQIRVARANSLRSVRDALPPGLLAGIDDLAALLGCSRTAIDRVAPRSLAVRGQVPTEKKAALYRTSQVVDHIRERPRRLDGRVLSDADAVRLAGAGEWLTSRALTEALLGDQAVLDRSSTREQRALVQQFLKYCQPDRQPGTSLMTVDLYPADEVITLLADDAEHNLRASDAPLESVLTTREMFENPFYQERSHDAANYAIRLAAAIQLPHAKVPLDPYVLGAWLGDGTTRSGNITSGAVESCTDIETGLSDQAHMIEQLRAAGLRPVLSEHQSMVILTSGLPALLREAGVLGNKHIPARYLRSSYEQRLALLQGLLDTDGSIADDGGIEFCVTHRRLAHDTLELIRSLGIRASIRSGPAVMVQRDPVTGEKIRTTTGTRYRIKLTTMAPVFRLPRKARKIDPRSSVRRDWLYVTKIEKSEPEPVRCLMVDSPDHLYLTDGFVPTHNSVAGQALLYGALASGADIAMIDIQKQGADFSFAKPHTIAFAVTVREAAATMEALYAEVRRRAELNGRHGAGSTKDLPEELRPRRIVLFIDEFLGVIIGRHEARTAAGGRPGTRAGTTGEGRALQRAQEDRVPVRPDRGRSTQRRRPPGAHDTEAHHLHSR